MSIRIRPLVRRDEAEQCADWMARSEPWLTLKRDKDMALRMLTNPDKGNWVAEDAGELQGVIVLDLGGPLPGYLQTICVRPERRGHGIGEALMQFAEARVFESAPNMFLCVSSFNAKAQRFYQRLGFAPVGVLRDFVIEGHDEILMRKTCGSWTAFRTAQASKKS